MNKKTCIIKSLFITGILLVITLTGCTGKNAAPKKGDFSFELPEGYSVSNVTDDSCSIVCNEYGTSVGGFEITQLNCRDLKNFEIENIMLYLQNEFHKTNNIEFISSHWGDEHPIISINLTKIEDDTGEKSYFSHVFFEKDSCVYHMWLDLDLIDADLADQFISTATKD